MRTQARGVTQREERTRGVRGAPGEDVTTTTWLVGRYGHRLSIQGVLRVLLDSENTAEIYHTTNAWNVGG